MCSGERLCRLSVRMSLYAENDLSTSTEVTGQYLNALIKLYACLFVAVVATRRPEPAERCDPHLHGHRPVHVHATSCTLPQAFQQEGRPRGTSRYTYLVCMCIIIKSIIT